MNKTESKLWEYEQMIAQLQIDNKILQTHLDKCQDALEHLQDDLKDYFKPGFSD